MVGLHVTPRIVVSLLALVCCGAKGTAMGGEGAATALPEGVRVIWDVARAHRELTDTRQRVCINGLWRWQPAEAATETVPASEWGYFKVPGPWPSSPEGGEQTLHVHPVWAGEDLSELTAAWYQREVAIPDDWAGRRIAVRVEYLNSFATVYVDGKSLWEVSFPGGELDITPACRPGARHLLSLHTAARPLEDLVASRGQTDEGRRGRGRIQRRGLCGDVFLVSTPAAARIKDVKIDPSVRNWSLTCDTALLLEPGAKYSLHARVLEGLREVKAFASPPFTAADLRDGRFAFATYWRPDKLWDLHTSQNLYSLELTLLDAGGKVLDVLQPVRFGFREFWIDGRDFYLNGTRIFCPVVPFENANRGVQLATYKATRETFLRLRSLGINTVFTHYYNCRPGAHTSLSEIPRAADDVGMLVAISQPRPRDYEWDIPDADKENGYARHAEYYVRAAQNHPSVVMYAGHNPTGYHEDRNPDQIGVDVPAERAQRNVDLALRAEAIVRRLDPSRVYYHHSSGNLSGIYTSNFYLNFVPIQERADWFERWSKEGVFPVLLVEYGQPLPPTWTTYRGWYKGNRAFLSADVPWELCTAEYSAQLLGDRAFELVEKEKVNLRFETAQFRAGRTWQRFEYPYGFNSSRFAVPNRCEVQAMYIKDNWPAFRTWGLSGPSGWSFGRFWTLPEGLEPRETRLPVDWDDLQRPSYSVDLAGEGYSRFDTGNEVADWIATSAAEAYTRYNQPLLAYIGGRPERFSTKDHNFLPGEQAEKQIIIKNTRQTVTCDWSRSAGLPQPAEGSGSVTVETGQIERVPVRIALSDDLGPGTYPLRMTVKPDVGEVQEDRFEIHVVPPQPAMVTKAAIALFDPKGETDALLRRLGVQTTPVAADADFSSYDVVVVGKGALTLDGPAPEVSHIRDGLKVIVFEQTADALEKRLGFRVQEYGLRRVFARVPDHPLLAGLANENLRDWRGEATIMSPRLEYEMWRRHGPSVVRSGIRVTRPWRCGCWGNVASVLIEKPARGDFLPIADGGFSLQYSPLMVYREGKGVVVFCQMDVTGRSEADPAGTKLGANILDYVQSYTPEASRKLLYVGEAAGRAHPEAAGMSCGDYAGGPLGADDVLAVGPGGGRTLAAHAAAVGEWAARGGHVLSLSLSGEEAAAFLPFEVETTRAEHICTTFAPPGWGSLLAGVGPADVHNRDPREVDLVSGGAQVIGNGVLALAGRGNVAFCQIAPWQFDYTSYYNQKRTFRRTSCLLTRVLSNMGVLSVTPVLDRFSAPADAGEERYLDGLYLEKPEEWDDPYRYFRW